MFKQVDILGKSQKTQYRMRSRSLGMERLGTGSADTPIYNTTGNIFRTNGFSSKLISIF